MEGTPLRMKTTDLPDSAYTVMPSPASIKGDSPEAVIRRGLWYYPTLFQNRTDVLAHLFLSYGNGYEWYDGELVAVMRDDREDEPSDQVHDDGSTPGIFANLRANRDAEYAAVRRDLERAATTHGPLRDRLTSNRYSRTYSYLWNAPDDMTPAWRAIYEEAQRVLQPLVDEVESEIERLAPHRAALVEERRKLQDRLDEIDGELHEIP